MSNKIIVTIMDEKKSFMYDIQVPNDLEGDKLTDDIVQTIISFSPEIALNPKKSVIYIPKHKTKLDSCRTLDEAGVFNGDYLIIG